MPWHWLRIPALLATALLGFGACSPKSGDLPQSVDNSSIVFMEREVLPLTGSKVISLRITVAEGDRPIRIQRVSFAADTGLRVRYLGFSLCKPFCLARGEFGNESDRQDAEASLEGTLPVEIRVPMRSSADVRFVIVLEAAPATSSCVRLRHATLTSVQGRKYVARAWDGGWVAALEPETPQSAEVSCGDTGGKT